MTSVIPKERQGRTSFVRRTSPGRPRSGSFSSRAPCPVRPGGGGGTCDALLDDAVLIERIAHGDQKAASDLVERLRPTILKCVRRRLPRWASEEDLVQSVLAKVFSHLQQFSGSVPLEH